MASKYLEYSYNPLEAHSFRVLALFGVDETKSVFGSSNLPLYGRITHAWYEQVPAYDALSYVWGDPTATERILLCDDDGGIRELGVAANLANALRALRHQHSAMVMWIDAICINQRNLTERSSEVQHMHRIYSQAACVRAWIDVNLDPTDPAVHRLSMLSPDHVTRFEKAEVRDLSMIVHVDPDEDSDDDGIGDKADVWQSLQALCDHTYWGRVWIQQEIYNARALVIHCGSTVISGEDFAEFLRQLNARSNTAPEKQGFRDPESWADLMTPIQSMEKNHRLFYGKARKAKAEWKREKAVPKEESKSDLFDAFVFAKHWLNATDPRDYVYGILSLVDDFMLGKLDIQVDYNSNLAQVYTESVDVLIRNYESLRFLIMADLETSRSDRDLPSWVPDWSIGLHHIPLHEAEPLSCREKRTMASWLPSISPCRRVLAVTGTRVAKILQVYADIEIDPTWGRGTPVRNLATMFDQLQDITREGFKIQRDTNYERTKPADWPTETSEHDPELVAILKTITALEASGESRILLEPLYEVFEQIKHVIDALLDVDDRIEPMPTTALGAMIVTESDLSMRRMVKSLLRMNGIFASRDGGDATLATVLEWTAGVPGAKNRLLDRVYCATWRRRVFLSEEGLMGLAPKFAVAGDELWFLPGCEVPVVLRSWGDQYVVVGEGHINDYLFSGMGPVVGDAYDRACTLVDKANFKQIFLV